MLIMLLCCYAMAMFVFVFAHRMTQHRWLNSCTGQEGAADSQRESAAKQSDLEARSDCPPPSPGLAPEPPGCDLAHFGAAPRTRSTGFTRRHQVRGL